MAPQQVLDLRREGVALYPEGYCQMNLSFPLIENTMFYERGLQSLKTICRIYLCFCPFFSADGLISIGPKRVKVQAKCFYQNYWMRKSRSLIESPCFCDQYRINESRIKTLLIQRLSSPLDPQQFGVESLLTLYFETQSNKLQILCQLQSQLRNHFKQDPTLRYNQQHDISRMVDNLIVKLKKEREVHHIALKKQRDIVEKYIQKEREAQDQISYLKELLNEEQIEVQNWKAESSSLQAVIKELRKEVSFIKFQNQQLRQIQSEHDERVNALNNRIQVLERDKLQLSKDCLQRSEDITKLAEQFQSTRQTLKYQAKLEILQELNAHNEQPGVYKLRPRKELLDKMRSLSLINKPDTLSQHKQSLNRSLSKDRHPVEDAAFQNNFLNKSISTANPETSRLLQPQKTESIDLPKQQIFMHLFVGDVLANEDKHRYFLVSNLQKHQRAMITRTRLIYRWDLINTANIHRYIDGHPHVMVLIKTEKGQHIGAYSQGAFRHRSISNQFGLLMSFENEVVFRNVKKSIVYDENQIIFGNYDLKIKSGENKVSSNFGLPGCFYEHAGYYPSTLLGEGKSRQARIKYMEIFEVFFQS